MTSTHLLDIAVETEEVENTAAVHLNRMETAHHGDRASNAFAKERGRECGGGLLE